MASQVALVVKNPPTNAGDIRSHKEGKGNPLQYSCLEYPMYRGAWWLTVQRVAKSQTQLKQLSMHAYDLLCRAQGPSQSFLKPPGFPHCPRAAMERLRRRDAQVHWHSGNVIKRVIFDPGLEG